MSAWCTGELAEELKDRRGVQKEMKFLDANRVLLDYEVPGTA